MNPTAIIIKSESPENKELIIPDIVLDAPEGFEQDEWAKLTDGWNSQQEEIGYWISQRGGGSSRKGRPTNFKASFKGELSNSSRAIQQRIKAAQHSAEDSALNSAGSSDRAAKLALRKKFDSNAEYKNLPEATRKIIWAEKLEELEQKRFEGQQSLEWLQSKLHETHRKWAHIQKTVDRRKHERVLGKLKATNTTNSTPNHTRAAKRIYGAGGIVQKLMRKVYQDGYTKLKTDEIQDNDAQGEWNKYIEGLSSEELAMVTSKDWVEREPTPPPEYIYQGEDIILDADRPYIKGNNDDECEEEVDNDSEIEEWLESRPNEYESENEFLAAIDEEDRTEESETESDNSEDETEELEEAEDSDLEMIDQD